jgi:hypothetical protein
MCGGGGGGGGRGGVWDKGGGGFEAKTGKDNFCVVCRQFGHTDGIFNVQTWAQCARCMSWLCNMHSPPPAERARGRLTFCNLCDDPDDSDIDLRYCWACRRESHFKKGFCLNKKCCLYTMFSESWNPRQRGRAADKRQSYDRAYEDRLEPQRKRSKGQNHWWAARQVSTARSSTDPAPAEEPPVVHMEIVSSEEEWEPQEEWEDDWAEEEDWVDAFNAWNAPADDAPLPGAATPPAPAPAQDAPVDDMAIGARHVMILF